MLEFIDAYFPNGFSRKGKTTVPRIRFEALAVGASLALEQNPQLVPQGVETWVDSEQSETYSLASLLQEKLVDLYPYKEREGYNRGVKYALGEIGEANDNYVRFGILIEVAHHDDYQDAKWMVDQQKEIGYALAEVILNYFQIS